MSDAAVDPCGPHPSLCVPTKLVYGEAMMQRLLVTILLVLTASIAHASENNTATVEWLYNASVSMDPLVELSASKTNPNITETREQASERRSNITRSIWIAANDPNTPMLFTGPRGREFTALFVLGIWHEESHFDLRIDKHHCVGIPPTMCPNGKCCDSGHAWCLGQIHPKDVPQLGYTGEELQADNVKCARATITRLAAAKAGTPQDANPADRFCSYAVGHFESPCAPMRLRYSHAAKWNKEHPAP